MLTISSVPLPEAGTRIRLADHPRAARAIWEASWVALLVAVSMLAIAAGFSEPAAAAIAGCRDGRIAFDSVRDSRRDIYLLNPFTGGAGKPTPDPAPTRLTIGPNDAKPSWSPPDANINNDCLNHNPDPHYAPPPTMVAFQRTLNGVTNIFALDAATPEPAGTAVQVTHDNGADTAPAWAPFPVAGAPKLPYPPIAFERNVDGHHDIFIANYDGTDETNLTNSSGADFTNPDWSSGTARDVGTPPSEAWLTFDSNEGGGTQVWVMAIGYNASNPAGHRYVNLGAREVTTGQPVSSNPSWFFFSDPFGGPGPAYDRVAFAGPDQNGGPSQINIADSITPRRSNQPFADPASSEFSALTSGPTDSSAPAWAPTGDYIAYQKTARNGQSDIYALDPTSADETSDVNLTQHVGTNQNPDWEALQIKTADVYPIRPLGRRHHTRRAQDVGSSVMHTLTASVSGSGQGVVNGADINCPPTCAHTYPYGTVVTLEATAAPGSTLVGWTGAGCAGTGSCTVTVTTDAQVHAEFSLIAPTPPVLSALVISPRRFTITGHRVAGRCVSGAPRSRSQHVCRRTIVLRVSYGLSIPARVTFKVFQLLTGNLVNGRCVPATSARPTSRRCVRLIRVGGTLVRDSVSGPNAFVFRGVMSGRRIGDGSYRLFAAPNSNGSTGIVRSADFQIA